MGRAGGGGGASLTYFREEGGEMVPYHPQLGEDQTQSLQVPLDWAGWGDKARTGDV